MGVLCGSEIHCLRRLRKEGFPDFLSRSWQLVRQNAAQFVCQRAIRQFRPYPNIKSSLQQWAAARKGIFMEYTEILKTVDHTLLTQTATWEEIQKILDEGIKYQTASACIPAAYVKQAAEYVNGELPICTVIGFPNGYSTTAVKVFETEDAVANGADEIDMVINIGWLKDRKYQELEEEIRRVHDACKGRILKVIIETCLLTREEMIKMCEIVTTAGAEYIKTSTGFSAAGAVFEDVELMKKHIGAEVKVKAAGGIASLADAEKFLRLGADRLGTSRIVKLTEQEERK